MLFSFGAGGGGRTRTMLPPRDFESRTSASSVTPACDDVIILYFYLNCNRFFEKKALFSPAGETWAYFSAGKSTKRALAAYAARFSFFSKKKTKAAEKNLCRFHIYF